MGIKAILLQKKDDVVTLTREAAAGDRIEWQEEGGKRELRVPEDIPIYHKAACREIKKGEYVYKYGEVIGVALMDILPGQWVYTGNLISASLAEAVKQAEDKDKERQE